MKAIDTNVLVRIIIQDDEHQSEKALAYIKRHGEVFISLIVLCEFVWVCSACYDLKKADLLLSLQNILSTSEFTIENSDVAWLALREYKASHADFSDCLIGSLAKHCGCDSVATFDKKAAHSVLFERIH